MVAVNSSKGIEMTAYEQCRMFDLMDRDTLNAYEEEIVRQLWERYQDQEESDRKFYQIDPGPAL
jgi:tRNA uridine 5-carbamoylmethylation protein Kti12